MISIRNDVEIQGSVDIWWTIHVYEINPKFVARTKNSYLYVYPFFYFEIVWSKIHKWMLEIREVA
jgi:hypothetical protein